MIIERKKRSARRGIPRSGGTMLRTVAIAVLAVFAVLLAVRGSIERAFLQNAIASATGATVTIGAVHDGLGGAQIDDLQLRSGDALRLDVPRAQVRAAGGTAIQLEGPQLRINTAALDAVQMSRFAETIRRLQAIDARLRVTGGTIAAGPALTGQAPMQIENVAASFTFAGTAPSFDAAFNVIDGGTPYPVEGHGKSSGGAMKQRWTAAALPLAPFMALHPAPAIALSAGTAENVDLQSGPGLSGTATLKGVSGTMGEHRLENIGGPLAIASGRLGSSALSGTFDGVPFTFAGEADGWNNPAAGLPAGTRDTRALLRMLSIIAQQPNLQFVRLEMTAPGVAFGQYGVTTPIGPHVIQLITIDPAEPTLHFDTALSSDHVISKGERTTDFATRTGAIAGLNGDYFDIGRTYEPQGLIMRGGTLLRSPTDRAAAIFDKTNHVTFGEFALKGTVRLRDRFYDLTQLNTWPLLRATVITPDYGTELKPADGVTFARLEPIDEPNHKYRVTSVEKADHPLEVSLGVAFGPGDGDARPRTGDEVTIEYDLTPHVDGAVAGIGGGPILLKAGEWYEDPHAPAPDERDVRWPVDAVGVMADGTIVLAAVDGRHPERSVGMTRPEFADLLKSFGVTDAMALDSGGSVTMVARSPGAAAATLHNVPSDNSAERYVSDALLLYSTAPPNLVVTSPAPSPQSSPSPSPSP